MKYFKLPYSFFFPYGGSPGGPRGIPGGSLGGPRGIPRGSLEVSEASWIPQEFFSIMGSVSWVHRYFFSSLKMSKNVENHNKSQKRRENRFKTDILGSRIMTFGFEVQDPRVIPREFSWDPGGNEAFAIASA